MNWTLASLRQKNNECYIVHFYIRAASWACGTTTKWHANPTELSRVGKFRSRAQRKQKISILGHTDGFFHKRDRFSVLSPSEVHEIWILLWRAEAMKRRISTEGIKVETAVTISTLTTKNETGWAVVYEADKKKMLHISTLSRFRWVKSRFAIPVVCPLRSTVLRVSHISLGSTYLVQSIFPCWRIWCRWDPCNGSAGSFILSLNVSCCSICKIVNRVIVQS